MKPDPLFPTPAESKVIKQAPESRPRKHSLIPTSAEDTLAYWDKVRADERARLDAIGARDEEEFTDPITGETYMIPAKSSRDYFKSCIGDFPTPERLAQLEAEQAERDRRNAAMDEELRLQRELDRARWEWEKLPWYKKLFRRITSWFHERIGS